MRLRAWKEADRAPFAKMNADPRVMEFFVAPLTAVESDALRERLVKAGVEVLEVDGEFAGFVGLMRPTFEARFTPCIEIGWRLVPAHWNKGYATRAAREVLSRVTHEVVAFTSVLNLPSQRVMQKLGMRFDCEFEHPRVPEGHRLRRHVLYRTATSR